MLVGLIGRPSSGKSTFFKAATLADVLIADYPFATIKPNHGMGYVKIKDLAPEFGKIANPREGFVKGEKGKWRFVPFDLLDVAGLVEGASEGKGLGNEFLNDLSAADAFIHVVDMSGESDGEGKPVSGKDYYPGEDIEIIEKELDLWYYGILIKAWKVFSRTVEMQKKKLSEEVARQFSGLKVVEEDVKMAIRKTGLDVEKPSAWSSDEVMNFSKELRKVSKPMIIAANKMDRPNSKSNFEKVKKEFDYPIVPCFAEAELALREADKNKMIEYIPGENDFEILGHRSVYAKEAREPLRGPESGSFGADLNEDQKEALDSIKKEIAEFGSTGVQDVLNKVVFELLDQICVFPAGDKMTDSKGNVLPDCYLMRKGSTALDFAFRLHSDIGNGFVKAILLQTKRAVGKDYEIKHRDGLEIMVK